MNHVVNIVFRVDASEQIGTGHLMRCLALVDELRRHGAEVSFISRELPDILCDDMERINGCRVYRLNHSPKDELAETRAILARQQPVDWLIVDHYGLDAVWERQMRPYVKRIMVIDDLADRPHDCDILLDQNLSIGPMDRYGQLLPKHCLQLLGPQHMLLRTEFKEARAHLQERTGDVHRILVSFGGSDPTNETAKALRAIRSLNLSNISLDVVAGALHPCKEQVRELCSQLQHAAFHCQTDQMACLMSRADLAIGAGGSSMWERCFLKLPSIVLITARNQTESVYAAEKSGAIWNMGWHEQVTHDQLASAIKKAVERPDKLRELSIRAAQLMNSTTIAQESRLVSLLLRKEG